MSLTCPQVALGSGRRIFHGFQSRNLIIESGCGQLECSLLGCCYCALKKASLLSSSGGPLSRPRHVPSSFLASVNKEVRHMLFIAQCT